MSFNIFKKHPRPLPEPSVNYKATLEEGRTNPADDTSHIVMGLLNFFKGFKCLNDAKKKIESKCDIEKQPKSWKIEKIKQAWDEAGKITNASDKKHWAYVIMLQVMTHLYNVCTGQADEQNSRTGASKRYQIESIGAASGGQHSTFNEADDISKKNPSKEKLQKEDRTKKKDSEKSNSQTVYIKIPLSALSDNKPEDAGNVPSTYKFIDGNPSDTNTNYTNTNIRNKTYYIMSYNKENKNADWVYEILNESTLAKNRKVYLRFGKCMQNEDFVQGHLASAGNHMWCQEAYNNTFLCSNISPQFNILNNGIWITLENVCRDKILKDKEKNIRNVHVYTGPVLKEKTEKSKRKKIKDDGSYIVKAEPTKFFKVIIVENDNGTVEPPVCYLIPNKTADLNDVKEVQADVGKKTMTNKDILDTYEKSLEEIERLSGLRFTAEPCKEGVKDSIKTVEWEGEDGNGELCEAKIHVRISKP